MENTENTQFEPIVIEGELKFKIVITEEQYYIESNPNMAGEMAAILISLKISEKYKSDMQIAKDNKWIKKADKQYFKGRLDKLTHSVYSLSSIANDMIMTVLNKSQKKD